MDGTLVTWWAADWGTFHGGDGAVSVFFILQFFVFHILYIYLLWLSSTINKVGGRQEVFVTFRVSIDPGADFTFENKLSQAYYSASNIVTIIIWSSIHLLAPKVLL